MRFDQETKWVIPETPEEVEVLNSIITLLLGDGEKLVIQHFGDGEFVTIVDDCGKHGGMQSYRLELRRGRKMPIIPVEGLD